YDREGRRRSGGAFPSKSAALSHYRDVVEPEINGRAPVRRDVTLQELADTFLERHGTIASATTVATLRARLRRPLEAYGTTLLVDLEHMTDELAGFASKLPERFRY